MHRFANQRVSGEVHHSIRTRTGNGSINLPAIRKLALNEISTGINSSPMAFTQIIENSNLMPLIEQQLCANAADVARAANDKDFH